jgi:prepilin-type N-terminal cleavage/methylation domain-containing protein
LKTKSFTLIELLVVIAIIGLLASIVVVNINSARDKARIAKSVSFSGQIYQTLGSEAFVAWDFNDNTQDNSSNGNNCVNSGGVFVSSLVFSGGSFGKALSFNGSNAYCGNSALNNLQNNQLTMELWLKMGGQSTSFQHPIGLGGGHSATLYIAPNSYTLCWKFNSIGGVREETSITDIDTNWHQVVVSYDGTNIRAYIDGVFIKSDTASGQIVYSDNSLFIGTTGSGAIPGGNYTNALIDEVKIYNKSFSSAQIQKHYAEELTSHQLAEKK